MQRREFITRLGGLAAAWPLAVHAQQPAKMARIGFLGFGTAAAWSARVEALRGGLHEFGRVEGKNIVIEFRWTERADQLHELAAELVGMQVDLLYAHSSTEVEAALQATRTIPIVFGAHADPVGLGHVASLASPGGNATGSTVILSELAAKQLALLKEAVPRATRIGVLFSPAAPSHRPALQSVEMAGQQLGVQIHTAPLRSIDDIDAAYMAMVRDGVGAFLVLASAFTFSQRALLAELALKHRLPGMFGARDNAESGGLMSYAPDFRDLTRRAATYIDKILNGVKPADLPVEQASRFQLVLNLKTAKALGLTFPPLIMAQADEVIE